MMSDGRGKDQEKQLPTLTAQIDGEDISLEQILPPEEITQLLEILKSVPGRKRDRVITEMARVVVSTAYRGPIPPPEMLADYAEIDPNFPKTIMQRADDEQKHRHKLEDKALDAEISTFRYAQFFGFLILLGLLGLGAYSIFSGNTIGAVASIAASIASGLWVLTKSPTPRSNGEK